MVNKNPNRIQPNDPIERDALLQETLLSLKSLAHARTSAEVQTELKTQTQRAIELYDSLYRYLEFLDGD